MPLVRFLEARLMAPKVSLLKADLVFAAIVALGIMVGLLERASAPVEEAVRAEAAGLALEAHRRFDPSRPPPAMRADCLRSGRQFIAWRSDEEVGWRYACVSVDLRPEQLRGF